jgi:hypothetical protein
MSRCRAARVTRITQKDLPCAGLWLESPIRKSGLKRLVRKLFNTLVEKQLQCFFQKIWFNWQATVFGAYTAGDRSDLSYGNNTRQIKTERK